MMRSRDGFVLVVAVVIAAAAAMLAGALAVTVMSKVKVTSRAYQMEQAFFIAEAGVQRARAQVARDGSLAVARLGPDGVAGTEDDGIFAFGASVEFAGGAYAVRALSGVAVPPGIVVDTNRVLVVHSTGTYYNVTRGIEAAIFLNTSVVLPTTNDIDGALAFYGTNCWLTMAGSPCKVDGRDYDVPADFYGSGSAVWGTLNAFKPPAPSSAFGANPLNIVAHANAIYGAVPPNDPTRVKIGGGRHNTAYWTNIIAQLAPFADHVITGSVTIGGTTTLGTRANPKIVIVESNARLMSVGSVDGAGILIVKDGGALNMVGNFHFEGLVIGIGTGVPAILGVGNATILGATVCLGDSTGVTLVGTPHIRYSSQALGNLANLNVGNGSMGLAWWRELR